MVGQPSDFRPAWWCRNPHLQTLLPFALRHRPKPDYQRERIELPDGDFVDLDWLDRHQGSLTIILHGLEGSAQSHYVRSLITALDRANHGSVVMHFRGCSGEHNRLSRRYHSGDTSDIDYIGGQLRHRFANRAINVVGFSLGGSVVLNWLIELAQDGWLTKAAAVCVPLRLDAAAKRLDSGLSRIYQWHLIRQMRQRTFEKFNTQRASCPIDLDGLGRLRTFTEFDDAVTAPLHGFCDVHDYYGRCSVHGRLNAIRCSTLIVQSRDDPFMGPDDLDTLAVTNPAIELKVTEHGGHVGFLTGNPMTPYSWLDHTLVQWLTGSAN